MRDHTEMGNSPAAIRIFNDTEGQPRMRRKVQAFLCNWTGVIKAVDKSNRHASTLFKLVRRGFQEAAYRDFVADETIRKGLCSILCARYRIYIADDRG